MDASTPQVFATPRAARRASTQTLAMEMPQVSRVASGAATQIKELADRKLTREAWQVEAYQHSLEVGELGYVLNLLASNVAKGRLVVVERDEHGQAIEPEKDEDGQDVIAGDREKAERVLQAFRGPEGDHQAMLAAGAIHDQIAGEAILLGQPIKGTKGISWELVSVLEVVEDERERRKVRKRSGTSSNALSVADPTKGDEPLDPNAYMARYHRADWMHSGDASSALRRNASACREIILWTQLIETTIKSRLAAGILLVPEEVTFPPDDDQIEDESSDADRFVEMLVEHLSAPVKDRRSAASLAPMVVRVMSEYIDKWKLLSLTDGSLDLTSMLEARGNALHRLAAGLDIPLEIMSGLGGTSHWNAAGLEISEVTKHVIPLGERLARFFSTKFFRRMLIAAEGFDEATAERWSLEYDGSEILTRLDAAVSADALHKELLISDDARIEAHGFDPNQVRPSEEERLRRQVEKLGMVPDKTNRVILPAAGITLEALVEAGVDAATAESWLSGASAAPAPPPMFGQPQQPEDEVGQDGPPMEDEEMPGGPAVPASGEPGAEEMAIMERVRTAAAGAVERCLERSANQVITAAKRLPSETRGRVDAPIFRTGSRKIEVLKMLGPSDWKALGKTPEVLVRGAWDEYTGQAVMWIRDHLESAGVDPLSADEDARRIVSSIVTSLDALALSAFRRPLQREHGLSVPLALVRDAFVAYGSKVSPRP